VWLLGRRVEVQPNIGRQDGGFLKLVTCVLADVVEKLR
jgi:hypothetical protein